MENESFWTEKSAFWNEMVNHMLAHVLGGVILATIFALASNAGVAVGHLG